MRTANLATALLAICLGLVSCQREDPLEAAIREFDVAFQSKDVAKMAKFFSESSLAEHGISASTAADIYQREIVAGWDVAQSFEPEHDKSSGSIRARYLLRNAQGEELTRGFVLHMTDEGPRIVNPIMSAVATVAVGDAILAGKTPGGLEKLKAYRNFAQQKGPVWEEQYGLKGVKFSDDGNVETWSSLASRFSATIDGHEGGLRE